jgi:adenylate cyclase
MAGGVVLALFAAYVFNFDFLQSLENKTIDLRFELRGHRKPEAPVCIAAIDEKSLQEIGRWPWSRSAQADLVRALRRYGAKYVFYDVFFSEPEVSQDRQTLQQLEQVLGRRGATAGGEALRRRLLEEIRKIRGREDGDTRFARALREAGNVFLPIVPLNNDEGRTPVAGALNATPAEMLGSGDEVGFRSPSLILSIPKIQTAALDSGHIRYTPDGTDGIIRYYLSAVPYGDVWIPHVVVQMARHYLSASKEPAVVMPGEHLLVGGRKVPILAEGAAFIDYCGDRGTIPTHSVADILAERVPADQLKGQVVMVGATADGLFDMRPTPFTKAFPGVEVNATIFENLVAGRSITLAASFWALLLVVAMALVMWFLVPPLPPYRGIVVFWIILFGYGVVAQLFFSPGNIILPVVYPLLSLLLTYLVLTTYKLMTEVRHSHYMKQMFQSMVAPTVVEEILKMPSGIELGGEEKIMTVMFSDIRGFTTYSEKHTPHEVVDVLNEYLTQMTHLIFQTEGTLDKYIGDAIMAFWGSPAPQSNHAFRACSTALGMTRLLHETLHPKWRAEGREELQIGVGLSTGPMVVGFVGSEHIKNYTLIGDAVNLGSRLEGTTKEYHVEIIVSESTHEAVKGEFLFRELDLIRVKGKERPIRIFELMAHMPKATEDQKRLSVRFEEGLSYYRTLRFEEAEKAFQDCQRLVPADGPSKVFLERCWTLKMAPPEKGWDGVFTMKTK